MKPGTLSLEAVLNLPKVSVPEVSYDGRHIVYYSDQTGCTEMFLQALPHGEPRQLSRGNMPQGFLEEPVWSRDGSRVVFAKDNAGDEKFDLYSISTVTGEVVRLTDEPRTESFPRQFGPGDAWLSFLSNRSGQQNLFLLDTSGLRTKQITFFEHPVWTGGYWSPDGEWILFSANETGNLANQDIYVIQPDGTGMRRVFRAEIGSKDYAIGWLPEGRKLAFTSDVSGVNRPGILDLDSGDQRWLGRDGVDEMAVRVSPQGARILTLRNQDAAVMTMVHDLADATEAAIGRSKGFSQWPRFALAGRAVVHLPQAVDRYPEITLVEPGKETEAVLAPVDFGAVDPTAFASDRVVRYPSGDGLSISGLLIPPNRIREGEQHPALVYVHGGPSAQFFRMFDPFTQILSDHGFVILAPNVRGSTGYGVEFRDRNLNDWGGGDLEDLVAGTDFLKSLPYVDPNRIGLWGASYGGFLTYLGLVKHPDLWTAGVAEAGMTDLHLLYEQSMEHFKYILRQQMGDPIKNAELWRNRSAIHFVEKLRARIMILHGTNDPRCPVDQARRFRDRLLAAGRIEGQDFEYHELTDAGHGEVGLAQTVQTRHRILGFFEQTLGRAA